MHSGVTWIHVSGAAFLDESCKYAQMDVLLSLQFAIQMLATNIDDTIRSVPTLPLQHAPTTA